MAVIWKCYEYWIDRKYYYASEVIYLNNYKVYDSRIITNYKSWQPYSIPVY